MRKYCRQNNIVPFIDLNDKRGKKIKYKDVFTVVTEGVPYCKAGNKMHRDGSEKRKRRLKFRCPLSNRIHGCKCPEPMINMFYTCDIIFVSVR